MTWPTVKLEAVAQRGSGHTPSQSHPEYWNGGVKWVSLSDSYALDNQYIYDTAKKISPLGLRHSSAVLHPKGTVIVSRDAGVGKSAILGDEMAVSQHFIAWRCDEKKLHNAYLYQWLQSHKKEFERMAVGSTVKTIGLGYFKNISIPLPPVEVQKKIASILSGCDTAIETAEKLIAAKKRHYSYEIEGLIRNVERPLKASLSEILCESRESAATVDKKKLLSVRLYCKGVERREYRNQTEEVGTQYFIRRSGQIIYGKQNIFRGAIGLVPKEFDGYLSSQDLPAFDVNERFDPRWVYYYLSRPSFYKRLEALSAGSGSKRLHPQELYKLHDQFPQRDIQSKTADAIELILQEIDLEQRRLDLLRKQKRGLTQKLLTDHRQVKVKEQEVA